MSRTALLVLGVVVLVAGVVFSLQGFNVMKGSAMSGTSRWEVLGPIIAIIGLALVVASRRRR